MKPPNNQETKSRGLRIRKLFIELLMAKDLSEVRFVVAPVVGGRSPNDQGKLWNIYIYDPLRVGQYELGYQN